MGRPRKIRPEQDLTNIRRDPIQILSGMKDILPEDQKYWDFVVKKIHNLCQCYGFKRIDTPILEEASLFERGTGKYTDIVEKEMYILKDKSGQATALRPEATPGIVRAYIEHGMKTRSQPVKLYWIGPMFRHSRPQKGRLREFHQFNFEAIGSKSPGQDAEIILLSWNIYKGLGIKNLSIQINSIGCLDCRAKYIATLKDYYKGNKTKLCSDCKRRLEKNPLRLLDCKEEKCARLANKAPQIIDTLCENCHDHFKSVLEFLDELNLPYILNPRLVRGLDYYTRTVFEIWPEEEKAQASLGGGGRYDRLVEELGGDPTPAVGFAGGIERIISKIKEQKITVPEKEKPHIFLAQLGELAKKKAMKLFEELLKGGIPIGASFGKDSMKSQLKLADRMGISYTLIIGQKEALEETVIIRDMETGNQEIVSGDKIIQEIQKRLKSFK